MPPGPMPARLSCGALAARGAKAQTLTPVSVGDRVCSAVQDLHSLTPTVGALERYTGTIGYCDVESPPLNVSQGWARL